MAAVSPPWMAVLGGLALMASACSPGAAPASAGIADASRDQVSCNVARGEHSLCLEQLDPLDATRRLSLVAQCTESGGALVRECPTRHLVGVCEVQQDTRLAWSLNAVTRIHHYIHPDVLTPEIVESLAARCGGPAGHWTPAAPADGMES
ncbi:hypothetical protein [Luteitalea sp.]